MVPTWSGWSSPVVSLKTKGGRGAKGIDVDKSEVRDVGKDPVQQLRAEEQLAQCPEAEVLTPSCL